MDFKGNLLGDIMNLIDNPEQARRLARAILSDVAIYNREKVESGIKNDNLFDLLNDEPRLEASG